MANYARVKYESVYPAADLVSYGNQRQFDYDFVVVPGAESSAIRVGAAAGLSRQGSNGGVKPPLRIDRNGDLVVKTDSGEVKVACC